MRFLLGERSSSGKRDEFASFGLTSVIGVGAGLEVKYPRFDFFIFPGVSEFPVHTRAVLLKLYVLSSLLAGVAAVVMLARFNSANAAYGESYLLVTILAAVLGGVDPFGGFGKVGGLMLALIILQVISSAFNLLNLSQFLTLAIWGGILIAVAAVPHLRGRAER